MWSNYLKAVRSFYILSFRKKKEKIIGAFTLFQTMKAKLSCHACISTYFFVHRKKGKEKKRENLPNFVWSLPEFDFLPSAKYFDECFFSSLSSATQKTISKRKHSAKNLFVECFICRVLNFCFMGYNYAGTTSIDYNHSICSCIIAGLLARVYLSPLYVRARLWTEEETN